MVWRKDIRTSLLALLRAAANPWIWGPFLVLLLWTAGIVALASRVHLWSGDLIKDTVVWAVGPAFALYRNVTNLGQQPRFLRRTALGALKYSVFVDFYINLYAFSFPVELLFVPFVTLLVMLSLVAGWDKRYRAVKQVLDVLLGFLGIGLLTFVTISLINNWQRLDRLHDLRELLLPIWLTLAILPLLYTLSLYSNYQQVLLRLRFASSDRRVGWRAKLALFLILNVRTYSVSRFTWPWLGQLATAESFRDARRIVEEFARQLSAPRDMGRAEETEQATAPRNLRN